MAIPLTQLGVSTAMKFPEQKIELLANDEVRYIEISFQYLINKSETELNLFCEQLAKNNIQIWSVHSPFGKGVELSELDESLRFKAVAIQKHLLTLVKKVGAALVVLHPSSYVLPEAEEAAEKQLLKSLEELVPEAEKHGICYGLENLLPGCLATNPNDLLRIVKQFESEALQITFDTGHANCCGTFEESFKTLAPYIKHFHVHDNDGKGDLHLQPGKGNIDWKLFGEIYQSLNFKSPVILECETWGNNSFADMFREFNRLI